MPYFCLGLYSLLSLRRSEVSKAGVIIIKDEKSQGSGTIRDLGKAMVRDVFRPHPAASVMTGVSNVGVLVHCFCVE